MALEFKGNNEKKRWPHPSVTFDNRPGQEGNKGERKQCDEWIPWVAHHRWPHCMQEHRDCGHGARDESEPTSAPGHQTHRSDREGIQRCCRGEECFGFIAKEVIRNGKQPVEKGTGMVPAKP